MSEVEAFAVLFILQNIALGTALLGMLGAAFWKIKREDRDRLADLRMEEERRRAAMEGEIRSLRDMMAELTLDMHQERNQKAESGGERA